MDARNVIPIDERKRTKCLVRRFLKVRRLCRAWAAARALVPTTAETEATGKALVVLLERCQAKLEMALLRRGLPIVLRGRRTYAVVRIDTASSSVTIERLPRRRTHRRGEGLSC